MQLVVTKITQFRDFCNFDDAVAKLFFINGEMRESAWYSEMEFLCPLYESDIDAEFHVSQENRWGSVPQMGIAYMQSLLF